MQTKLIDYERLKSEFADDQDLLRNLVDVMTRELPSLWKGLELACQSRDPVTIEESAHRFKGAVSNLFAARLSDVSAQLEEMGRERKLDFVAPTLHSLRILTETFHKELIEISDATTTLRKYK